MENKLEVIKILQGLLLLKCDYIDAFGKEHIDQPIWDSLQTEIIKNKIIYIIENL